MPWEAAPKTRHRYYFLQLDSSGAGAGPDDRQFLLQEGDDAMIAADATDVFVASHGWMEDIDGAQKNYSAWIDTMVTQAEHGDAPRDPGFKPQTVAVHWPSQPFGDERPLPVPLLAGASLPTADDLADRYTTRILGTEAADPGSTRAASARAALKTIVDTADDIAHDKGSRRSLVRGDVEQLPKLSDAYQQLLAASGTAVPGLDPGQAIRQWTVAVHEEPPSPGFLGRVAADIERLWDGLVAALDHDATGVRDLALLPVRALSFWAIKDRAHTIGAETVHQFLIRLQETAPNARFHLMGHSFGAIVISSAILGPAAGAGASSLPRPASSVLLAQGAMSLWAYASQDPYNEGKAGDYHSVYAAGRPLVTGPLVTTQSVHDLANRNLFPIAAQLGSPDIQAGPAAPGAAGEQGPTRPAQDSGTALPRIGAVGTFGLQGAADRTDARTVHLVRIGTPHEDYQLEPGRIYNANADAVISKMRGLMGAHMDISHPEIAHLFWQAVQAGAR